MSRTFSQHESSARSCFLRQNVPPITSFTVQELPNSSQLLFHRPIQHLKLLASFLCRVVGLWRELLSKTKAKAAQSLADPTEYENLFPGLKDNFKTEQFLAKQRQRTIPARFYSQVPVSVSKNNNKVPLIPVAYLYNGGILF